MTKPIAKVTGTTLPLLFSYRDALFGNNFVVEVVAENGRALCVQEADGRWWMYGLNPGGMAAFGDDPDAAHREFRKTFSQVLKDLSAEAQSFEEYQQLVTTFFEDTNEGYAEEWAAAVRAVRNNEVGADLQKVPADSPRRITVDYKRIFKAEDNQPDLEPQLAA
jgi:hypothetical protein